jgi:hypothetical protein
VRPYVVSHLNAKLQNWQWAGIYFFQEKSRNVHRIAGLLIKCNLFAESPNLVQQTGPYSPSLLISCSVTGNVPNGQPYPSDQQARRHNSPGFFSGTAEDLRRRGLHSQRTRSTRPHT